MSYGAGHIMDMIQRMKQHRALKPSNRNTFKGQLRDSIHVEDTLHERLYFPEVTEEELQRIKVEIRYKAMLHRRRERWAYGVAIAVVVVLMLLVLLWI
ncbi:MAG: hypothetical protein ACK4UK_00370 [Flavobacterium sp.]